MDSPAFRPDWISAPGDTISDILSERRMDIQDFAAVIGKSVQDVTRLMTGSEPISPTIAQLLESSIGGSIEFWLKREKSYRQGLSSFSEQADDSDTREWTESLPLKDMIRWGWVPSASDLPSQVANCLRFFGVRNLDAWKRSYKPILDSAVFRSSAAFESKPGAVAAWLRRGEQESALVPCAPWNAELLGRVLNQVRALTRESDTRIFLPKLVEHLSTCGIAVVVLRAPDGCRASGAARFITPEKALMLLSFRHLSDDQFWFSVFHEAGHLLLHKDRVMVDAPEMPSSLEEEEANKFAADMLIPHANKEEMLRLPVNGRAVMRFARRIGIAPGIVVGQMQHLGRLTHRQLNNLKRRYEWSNE